MKNTTLLNLRIPKELVEKFKVKCDENYKTMSEAMRDLIKEYIRRENE